LKKQITNPEFLNWVSEFDKKDFKGYWTIDSISSQPRLLWLDMKSKGIVDPLWDDIFNNDKDFYLAKIEEK
jgi:hypothetical protein